jgi:hypothetical protein
MGMRWALVLVAIGAALPVSGAELQGSYRGVFNDVTLDVTGGTAAVGVTSGACVGYLEGPVTAVSETRWEILGSVAEAPCTLSIDATGEGRLEMNEGPGCTYYHGAICELSGILEKAQ